MRFVEPVFRPPSEAGSFLLQATVGCSWNHCTYCAMYRGKQYRVRPVSEILEDIAMAGRTFDDEVRKVFVLDGDALAMDLDVWEPILQALGATFPKLRRVSCYATAMNLLAKTQQELERLRALGLKLLYIGPESGDDVTLKRIAKGATSADHVEAAAKARAAGLKQSAIFLLGAGGAERSVEHATASARLATAMDPEYLSALTLMLIPGTPIHRLTERGHSSCRVSTLSCASCAFSSRTRAPAMPSSAPTTPPTSCRSVAGSRVIARASSSRSMRPCLARCRAGQSGSGDSSTYLHNS